MTSTTSSAAGIQDAARHLAEGRPAEAVAVLERLVADFPAYVTAYVLLAKAYEANGRDGEALGAWHHAYFLMPGSPLVVRERTRLLRTAPVAPATVPPPPAEAETPEREEHEAPPTERAEVEQEAVGAAAESAAAEPEMTEEAPEPATEPEWEAGPEVTPEPEDEPVADVTTESALGEGALGEVDDLDTLIHQLENAPRIRPDPDFRDEGFEDEDEDEGLVSETLARIYATQREYAAAARTYEQLAQLHPDRAAEFTAKASEMRSLASSSGS